MSKSIIALGFFALGLFAGVTYGKKLADRWHAAHPRIDYQRKVIQGFNLKGDCLFGGTDYNFDSFVQTEGPCVISELATRKQVK